MEVGVQRHKQTSHHSSTVTHTVNTYFLPPHPFFTLHSVLFSETCNKYNFVVVSFTVIQLICTDFWLWMECSLRVKLSLCGTRVFVGWSSWGPGVKDVTGEKVPKIFCLCSQFQHVCSRLFIQKIVLQSNANITWCLLPYCVAFKHLRAIEKDNIYSCNNKIR